MVRHSFRKIRPDRAATKRQKRGIFVCAICGQQITERTGIIDKAAGVATCERCIDRTAGTAVSHG